MTGCVRIAVLIGWGLVLVGCAASASYERPRALQAPTTSNDSSCLTATRPPAPGANCSGFGRSYSSEDMKLTGATIVGDALQLLDPSITVRH